MADTVKMLALSKLKESKELLDSVTGEEPFPICKALERTIDRLEKNIILSEIDRMTSTNAEDTLL